MRQSVQAIREVPNVDHDIANHVPTSCTPLHFPWKGLSWSEWLAAGKPSEVVVGTWLVLSGSCCIERFAVLQNYNAKVVSTLTLTTDYIVVPKWSQVRAASGQVEFFSCDLSSPIARPCARHPRTCSVRVRSIEVVATHKSYTS